MGTYTDPYLERYREIQKRATAELTKLTKPPFVGFVSGGGVHPRDFAGGFCPACGATPEELDLVRRRRALDGIMAEYEQHLSGCGECGGWAGPWCEAGRALRRRYLDAWLAWQGRGEGVA